MRCCCFYLDLCTDVALPYENCTTQYRQKRLLENLLTLSPKTVESAKRSSTLERTLEIKCLDVVDGFI